MKLLNSKTSILTPGRKAAAKANVLESVLTSFKIEGVTFSHKQIETIKSRAQFSK